MTHRIRHLDHEHESVADVRACDEHYTGTAANAAALGARPTTSGWKRGDPLPFPAGRYAILVDPEGNQEDITFLKVDNPTEGRWAGYVFLKRVVSDEQYPIRGQSLTEELVNTIIRQGWKDCLLRYGQKIGRCGHCGRTLTNEESRAYGIGPVCRRDPQLAMFA